MFEAWCLVEIMGHVQLAGKVTEEVVFGAPMMRVDVPETTHLPGFTKFYGAQSIYSITPVPEDVARAMAERLGERPWHPNVVGVALPTPRDGSESDDDGEDDELLVEPVNDDKRGAGRWAHDLLNDPAGFVVLDTETTGLGDDAEACQIAVIDQTGRVLVNTLVKPGVAISDGAIAVHGITNEMVIGAPSFADVLPELQDAIRGRQLVIYNAAYDLPILQHMVFGLDRNDLLEALPHSRPVHCAMLRYAEFWGDWNDYHGNYRWVKLVDACAQQGVDVDAPAHSALGDCLRTLGVMKVMADWYSKQPQKASASEIAF